MSIRVALLTMIVLAAACADERRTPVGVPFRVRTPVRGQDGALDDSPLTGGDRIVTWIERAGGETVDGSERTIALPTTELVLPKIPFGEGLVVRVDAYGGDVLLSRGRSFPFDVGKRGASSSSAPDLFLGSLGRFGRRLTATPVADPVAILPTSDGALVGCADGRVLRFTPFATNVWSTTAITLGTSATWLVVGDRLLAAFTEADKRLTLVAPDGTLAHTLSSGTLARHGVGAMLAADPTGTTIVIVGGDADGADESATAVTRVLVPTDPTTATAAPLASLPMSRFAGAAVWVEGTEATARVLVIGGQSDESATDAFLIDTRAGGTVAAIPAASVYVAGASIAPMGVAQVLSVGGAVADDVRLIIVTTDPPALTLASPSPPALSSARTSPRLVRFADELVLVVGGESGAALVRGAEIVDLRVFPGSTVQTGSLPESILAPGAALLADQSVWVLDRGGVLGYVVPRGESGGAFGP